MPETFHSRFSISHVASAKGRCSVGLLPPPKHPVSSEKKTSGTLKVLSELDHQARRMGWIYIMNSVSVIGRIQQLQTFKTWWTWPESFVSSVARTHVHSGELQFQKDVSPYFLVPESFQSRFSVSHVASAKGRSSVGLRPPPKHPAASEKKTSGALKVLSELDHQAWRMGWIYIMNSVCVIGRIQQLQTIKTFQSWKNAYV